VWDWWVTSAEQVHFVKSLVTDCVLLDLIFETTVTACLNCLLICLIENYFANLEQCELLHLIISSFHRNGFLFKTANRAFIGLIV
jgi:hypothetical protein